MPEPRRIAVATFGRSDFSILRPLCRLLKADPDFEVGMWVGGAHFEEVSGRTVRDVEASAIPIWARIEVPESDRSAMGTIRAMADQLVGFGAVASGSTSIASPTVSIDGPRPDLVLILGDRYEAVSAGLAMVPLGLPVGHISGGSVTEGAIDDVFRHCLTKIAAIHFCDLPCFARRIHHMGEPIERIVTVGALGLDAFLLEPTKPFEELAERFELEGLQPGFALVTLHPETQALEKTAEMATSMIDALVETRLDAVLTYPNADPGADEIVALIEAAAMEHERLHVTRGFGVDWFPSAMAHAGLMVGNSSAGIIEAASFGLPVVDIGDRQKGRECGANVVHCGRDRAAIVEAILEVTREEFTAVDASGNIYGDGRGAARVVETLRNTDLAALAGPKAFAEPDPTFIGERMALP